MDQDPYSGSVGESTRLRFGTRRIFERILEDPNSEWTIRRMRAVSNHDERSVDQAVEVLGSISAVTVESIPDRIWMEYGYKRISEHVYRLTDDGQRRVQDALDASRYRPGVVVTFFTRGWGPAKMAWQARRGAGRPLKARRRHHLAGDDDYSYFDPELNSLRGRLNRWLEDRYTRPRTKKWRS